MREADRQFGDISSKSNCCAGPHPPSGGFIATEPIIAPSSVFVLWPTTASLAVTSVDSNTSSSIVLKVNRDWAPVDVDRFYQLILDDVQRSFALFQFVVQFGIASDPNETAKWEFANIRDDPVRHSNVQGTVSFAMEAGVNDSRTTQLFINLHNNNSRRLDGLGFAPIGRIVAGLDVVGNVFNSTPNDPNGVDQDAYQNGGNEWILRHYPDIDIIVNSTLVMGEHKSNVQIAETPFAPISKDIPMAHSNGVLLSKLDLPRNSAAMWIAIFLLLLPFWTLFTFLSGIENRRLRVERVLSQVATATSTRSMRASL